MLSPKTFNPEPLHDLLFASAVGLSNLRPPSSEDDRRRRTIGFGVRGKPETTFLCRAPINPVMGVEAVGIAVVRLQKPSESLMKPL